MLFRSITFDRALAIPGAAPNDSNQHHFREQDGYCLHLDEFSGMVTIARQGYPEIRAVHVSHVVESTILQDPYALDAAPFKIRSAEPADPARLDLSPKAIAFTRKLDSRACSKCGKPGHYARTCTFTGAA